MIKQSVALLLFVALAAAVQAKPKTRTFNESCDRVFSVAENIASHKPYHIVLDGKKDMVLEVQTGSFWKAGASNIQVQFVPNNDGTCAVTDNSRYSGLRRNGTVFLDRLEKALKDTEETSDTASTSASKKTEEASAPAPHDSQMKAGQPSKPTADDGGAAAPAGDTGTVVVVSVPSGAEVYVDGNFVGEAPATLPLAPGKHTIRIASQGYSAWSRTLMVLASSDVRLTATLKKQD